MTIGQAIKKARTEAGYTQQKLAIKSGVSANTIRFWEKDRIVPSVILLSCVADVLNISLDELIGRNSGMTIKPNYFSAEGTVKLVEKQGKPQKTKDVSKKNGIKEICLNCTEPKCNGNCKKIKGVIE